MATFSLGLIHQNLSCSAKNLKYYVRISEKSISSLHSTETPEEKHFAHNPLVVNDTMYLP